MITRTLLILVGLAILAPDVMAGDRLFGSNLSWRTTTYPDPDCAKPREAPDLSYGAGEYETASHGRRVDDYNRQVERYRSCVERYRQGAQGDAGKIRRAADEAEGRRVMHFGGGTETNLPWRGYPSVEGVCGREMGKAKDRCVRQYRRDAENDAREIEERGDGL